MESAMNKVKDNQRKQMSVIKADLQRKEKNNIRLAVRAIKEKKIEDNLQEANLDRVEHIQFLRQRKMEGVEKNKLKMENEKEKKRIELMKKENEEMSPIRNKFNMTQKFNQNYLIPTKLRNKSQVLFKVEATPLKEGDKVGTLPPRPNRSGLRQSQGSFANRSHSRQIPSLGRTRQSFDPNAS